jgi:hypothetical protein
MNGRRGELEMTPATAAVTLHDMSTPPIDPAWAILNQAA